MPTDVKGAFGRQLLDAQYGDTPAAAKPLKGFGDASVVELIEDEGSSTYRAVYTVRFAEAVYVLHVFQKKSTKGIATPKADMDLVKRRLKAAEGHYQQHYRRVGHPKEDGHA
jgi:phage-related protein